ncbi:hypothetical protein ADUPG1_010000 [Aduncisulcus paluster]|uniref:Uncharacterized protein n=1 Tax=Aduncisulcus paluster TaxID=2918883 RepID=A0ABQ5KXH8_9EUKA|nr:hypothetical protein ADUPG1_010000 [Aduncisulcus paluster]
MVLMIVPRRMARVYAVQANSCAVKTSLAPDVTSLSLSSVVVDWTGIAYLTNLTSIIFSSVNIPANYFSQLPVTLTSLSFYDGNVDFSDFDESCSTLNSLTSLTFQNTNLASGLDFSWLSNLIQLDVSKNSDVTTIGPFPTSLETLSIDECTSIEFPTFFNGLVDSSGLSLPNLVTLSLSDTNVSSLDLVPESVTDLTAENCSNLSSFASLATLTSLKNLNISSSGAGLNPDLSPLSSLSALEFLVITNSKISDPSGFYSLSSTVVSIDLSGNYICGYNLSSSMTTIMSERFNDSVGRIITTGTQACQCFLTDVSVLSTLVADRKACVETQTGVSDTWNYTCDSESYTQYTAFNEYECVPACLGGCHNDWEICHVDPDDPTSGFCDHPILDGSIRTWVGSLMNTDDKLADDSYSLSAIVEIEPTVTSLSFTEDGSSISDLRGLEHLTSLSSLTINDAQSLVDLSPLEYLHLLSYIDLSGCGVEDTTPIVSHESLVHLDLSDCPLTDISGLADKLLLTYLDISSNQVPNEDISSVDIFLGLHSIEDLRFNGLSNVTSMPLMNSADVSTLQRLECQNTGIQTLSTLGDYQGDTVTHIIMNGADLLEKDPEFFRFPHLDVLEVNDSSVRPVFIRECTSLTVLKANNNGQPHRVTSRGKLHL